MRPGWDDFGWDPFGQHRWLLEDRGQLFVVSDGRLGIFALVPYQGINQLPYGQDAARNVHDMQVFLEGFRDHLFGLPADDRHVLLRLCHRPWGPFVR